MAPPGGKKRGPDTAGGAPGGPPEGSKPRLGVDTFALEVQIGHLLRRAHQRSKAVFAVRVGEPKLTPRQFAALVKIREQGRVSQNLLGRQTAMDPATAQGVVRRLCARGFVDRQRDPEDRRRAVLTLTAAGDEAVTVAIDRLRGMNEEILDPLGPAERRSLIAFLQTIAWHTR